MQKLLISSIIILICTTVVAQPPVDSSRVIRVLTYNILHGETLKGDFDLDRIAEVIKSVKPDLVALQEVDTVLSIPTARAVSSSVAIPTTMV